MTMPFNRTKRAHGTTYRPLSTPYSHFWYLPFIIMTCLQQCSFTVLSILSGGSKISRVQHSPTFAKRSISRYSLNFSPTDTKKRARAPYHASAPSQTMDSKIPFSPTHEKDPKDRREEILPRNKPPLRPNIQPLHPQKTSPLAIPAQRKTTPTPRLPRRRKRNERQWFAFAQ